MSVAVSVSNVTKVFTAQVELGTGLKEIVLHPLHTWRQVRKSRFVAVEDVSLSVDRGEIYGLVGRNGAGKSTLLGMIGGVMRPTSGSIHMEGRISPLLELGVGFVPQLTGLENAVLNGVLLGMLRQEIESRIPSIIAFAGLEDFAHQPIKTYSSGMQSRLGFSVAVHADPDILLVDEVLAVGDIEFQDRCLERIAQLHRMGVTILFVSHDMETVAKVCDRATWIEHGRVAATGAVDDVILRYRRSVGLAPPVSMERLKPSPSEEPL